jgi:hypothetical protein
VIDLGPRGGDGGGEIVAWGPPEDIVKAPRSYTGKFLGVGAGDDRESRRGGSRQRNESSLLYLLNFWQFLTQTVENDLVIHIDM